MEESEGAMKAGSTSTGHSFTATAGAPVTGSPMNSPSRGRRKPSAVQSPRKRRRVADSDDSVSNGANDAGSDGDDDDPADEDYDDARDGNGNGGDGELEEDVDDFSVKSALQGSPTARGHGKVSASPLKSKVYAVNEKGYEKNYFNLPGASERHRALKQEAQTDNVRSFLKERLDSHRRPPTDPDYDPTTLYIPPSAYAKMTKFERQYWENKSRNFDSLLLFKKGYFLELYEEDADVAARILGLKVTRSARAGGMSFAGIPVAKTLPWIGRLLELGYKVARVDEVETSVKMHAQESAGKDILRRELTRKYTPATVLEDVLLPRAEANYLLAFIEENLSDPAVKPALSSGASAASAMVLSKDSVTRFYVCFTDIASGEVNLAQLDDDAQKTNFETLLAERRPTEVLTLSAGSTNRFSPSRRTSLLVKNVAHPVAVQTVRYLDSFVYSGRNNGRNEHSSEYDSDTRYAKDFDPVAAATLCRNYCAEMFKGTGVPEAYEQYRECDGVMAALWMVIQHLNECMVANTIERAQFRRYQPGLGATAILDGQTIRNLSVLQNEEGSFAGTVLHTVGQCATGFGQRLLRIWVCHPCARRDDILDRQAAVDALATSHEALGELREDLGKLPDLERSLARAHALSIQPGEFQKFLQALKDWAALLRTKYRPRYAGTKSAQLRSAVFAAPDGAFPDIDALVDQTNEGIEFQRDDKQRVAINVLKEGISAALDEQNRKIREIYALFERQLEELRAEYGAPDIRYLSNAATKESFVLEVPEACFKKHAVPSDWTEQRGRKGWRRFQTPLGMRYAQDLALATELRNDARAEVFRDVLLKFDEHHPVFAAAIDCIARLDCLQTIAGSRFKSNYCTPTVRVSKRPYLKLVQSRHPCLEELVESFVPNDIVLGEYVPPHDDVESTHSGSVEGKSSAEGGNITEGGADGQGQGQGQEQKQEQKQEQGHLAGEGCTEQQHDAQSGAGKCSPILLLTGPNMGGKSTFLRQCCVTVLMAQLGCDVPAEQCEFSPVDRIFTRIGACDNIMLGRSTFMVELQEAASVLHFATPHSLVLLDELGRGTSTHDGYAIAYAVLKFLAEKVGCITLFSTHYHQLASEFSGTSAITLKHMACICAPPEQQQQQQQCFTTDEEIEKAFEYSEENAQKQQQQQQQEQRQKADDTNKVESVVFLYQVRDGISPASYGLNVALMAGVPRAIVEHAKRIATKFAETSGFGQNQITLRAQRIYRALKRHDYGALCKERAMLESTKM